MLFRSQSISGPTPAINSLISSLPNNTGKKVDTQVVEYGYQKVKEMYSEYKAKGLIPKDFPELTVVQMAYRLQQFIQTVLETFTKENLDPLTYVDKYQKDLEKYRGDVLTFTTSSWFNKYMDTKNPYVLKQNKVKVYFFRKDINEGDNKGKLEAISELNALIDYYNQILNENPTLGKNGSYEIAGKTTPSAIESKINYNLFKVIPPIDADIDFEETWKIRNGGKQGTPEQVQNLEAEFIKTNETQGARITLIDGVEEKEYDYFKFEGKDRKSTRLNSSHMSESRMPSSA